MDSKTAWFNGEHIKHTITSEEEASGEWQRIGAVTVTDEELAGVLAEVAETVQEAVQAIKKAVAPKQDEAGTE